MYKEEKVYIPKNDTLRAEIIRLHHDILVGGYERQWKTVELVTRKQQNWLLGNSRIGYQELLVAKDNKESKIIYERVQFLLKEQKPHRIASRQANTQLSSRCESYIVYLKVSYQIETTVCSKINKGVEQNIRD